MDLKLDLQADHRSVAGGAARETGGFSVEADAGLFGQAPFGAGDDRLFGGQAFVADALIVWAGADDDFVAGAGLQRCTMASGGIGWVSAVSAARASQSAITAPG